MGQGILQMKTTYIFHKKFEVGNLFFATYVGLPLQNLIPAILPINCIGLKHINVGGMRMPRKGTFYWVKHEGVIYK